VIAVTGTYMNRSGEAVKCFVERFEIDEKRDLLVVLDDADLQLGRIRLRESGSSGGHKGLASVAQTLGTDRFARLRIGIGRPSDPEVSVEEFVLRKFALKEKKVLEETMERAREAALSWAREGVQKAMNRYNMDSIDSQKKL
jgi:PTH1 family peptidyl-tRNA hydrolase